MKLTDKAAVITTSATSPYLTGNKVAVDGGLG